jgi:hypothetical protein
MELIIVIKKNPSFIINNDNSAIESMIIKNLCYKKINNLYICEDYLFRYKYFFTPTDNEYNIYYYHIERGLMKELLILVVVTNISFY